MCNIDMIQEERGYDKEMTSLYGWYDSPSPANDFKCVRIFQHENNKNSDKGA